MPGGMKENMEDFDPSNLPEGMQMPQGGMGGFGGSGETGEPSISFYMQDKVNNFSGLTQA